MTIVSKDLPKRVKISELQLADVVDIELNEGYSTATVEELGDKRVKLIRPYVHDAGFSCGDQVITYLGWEYLNFYWYDNEEYQREVILLRRSKLK